MSDLRISPRALERALGEWRGNQPMHQSLHDRIRLLILDGRLPTGARLPAERTLADTLAVSRTTVSTVYDALRSAGYLHSLVGSGTRVSLPGPALELPDLDRDNGAIDLGKAAPPASVLVPAAVRRAAEELPRFLPGSGYDLRGLPHLRAAVAEHYSSRGLTTDPDQILVTLGAQHAIQLLARAFLRPGALALIETPTYPHAVDALLGAGARLLSVPVGTGSDDWDGWDPAGVATALHDHEPALAYLMPDFHNPTGSTMSPATREIIGAAAGPTVLVVDETTAFLSVAPRQERGFLAGAVHIGSTGKLFWGGLRVGWIRADRAVLDRILAARPAHDLGTPVVEQLAVAHLVPQIPAATRERAGQLGASAEALTRLAAAHLPGWTVPTPAGGLAAWATLPRPAAVALALAAREHGVLVPPGPRFSTDGRGFERHLRLPITASPQELGVAIPALAAAWEATGRGAGTRRRARWSVV